MINISGLYADRIGKSKIFNKSCTSYEEMEILDFSKEINESVENSLIVSELCKHISENSDFNYLDFNKACAAYLRMEQFVDVDYKSEIVSCNGVKEALRLLPLAFINKDDYIITTIPGCNIISNMGKWLDCKVYEYNLNKFNNYMIDFDDINEDILKKCKLLYINYPNNPTGMIASKEFYKEVIKYAKKYNFIVINDATYLDLCFDELDKISFLNVEGAKDVGIELYSFSQVLDMGKYKVGFIAGNKEIIKAYNEVKNNLDIRSTDVFFKASIEGLNNFEKIITKKREIYFSRHNHFKEAIEKIGFRSSLPKAGPYQYVEIPKRCNGVIFESANEFALWLKDKENIIVKPYNENNYVRVSLNYPYDNEEKEKNIFALLEERLSKYKFEYK